MAEDLGSTNITDLINEDDTDMNDDVVNKILNELENEEPNSNQNNINNDIINTTTFEEEIANNFPQRNPTLDFRDPDFNKNSVNFESENTVNKINTIINDSNKLELTSISSIINNFKIPILVFILSFIFNNPILTNLISTFFSNIIKNNTISDYISLFLRTILISLILFLLKFFSLI